MATSQLPVEEIRPRPDQVDHQPDDEHVAMLVLRGDVDSADRLALLDHLQEEYDVYLEHGDQAAAAYQLVPAGRAGRGGDAR